MISKIKESSWIFKLKIGAAAAAAPKFANRKACFYSDIHLDSVLVKTTILSNFICSVVKTLINLSKF